MFTCFVECCNRLFQSNQTCCCAGMVSVTSTSHYQSPCKVDPLCMAEVNSAELADVPADRGLKVKYNLISITKSISKIFIPNVVCVLTNERYKTYQTVFLFDRLGHALGVGLWDLLVKD